MKRVTRVALAGVITLGGLGIGSVANFPLVPNGHIQEADAASSYGVSVNSTKTNWTKEEPIIMKFINHNSFEVRLVGQLQHLENGKWVNVQSASQWYAVSGEKFGTSFKVDTNGTYRYKLAVYHITKPLTNYDGTFAGNLYSSNFDVK
ncbi:hypothetical protein [Priestia megaterium]|uniref:hypothetical protein n=1 Tax=Priestia megaterium TaxID=1404 RepID=UPI00101BBC2F|nr:hypothetical protein [Priestia megaterium]